MCSMSLLYISFLYRSPFHCCDIIDSPYLPFITAAAKHCSDSRLPSSQTHASAEPESPPAPSAPATAPSTPSHGSRAPAPSAPALSPVCIRKSDFRKLVASRAASLPTSALRSSSVSPRSSPASVESDPDAGADDNSVGSDSRHSTRPRSGLSVVVSASEPVASLERLRCPYCVIAGKLLEVLKSLV